MAMTTLAFENTAEGGTDDVNVSTANSGGASGTAWSLVNTGGTPDPVYDDAQAMHGSMSILFPAGTAREVRWYGLDDVDVYAAAHWRFASLPPSANVVLMQFRTAADGVVGTVSIRSDGRIIVTNRTGGTVLSAAGWEVSVDTWYRIEAIFSVNTTTGTEGRVQLGVYVGDSSTPIITEFDSGAAADLGTTAIDRIYLGAGINGTTTGDDTWMDSIGADPGRTTFYGPWVTAVYPWGLLDGVGGAADMEMILI